MQKYANKCKVWNSIKSIQNYAKVCIFIQKYEKTKKYHKGKQMSYKSTLKYLQMDNSR